MAIILGTIRGKLNKTTIKERVGFDRQYQNAGACKLLVDILKYSG